MEGTVKFYDSSKGYGFIIQEDSHRDIFVHQTGLVDDIQENDRVTYEVEQGNKGPKAINVKIL